MKSIFIHFSYFSEIQSSFNKLKKKGNKVPKSEIVTGVQILGLNPTIQEGKSAMEEIDSGKATNEIKSASSDICT